MEEQHSASILRKDDYVIHNRVISEHNPWDDYSIPKHMRKGKTPEELQSIRRRAYFGSRMLNKFGREQCTLWRVVDADGLLDEEQYDALLKASVQKTKES